MNNLSHDEERAKRIWSTRKTAELKTLLDVSVNGTLIISALANIIGSRRDGFSNVVGGMRKTKCFQLLKHLCRHPLYSNSNSIIRVKSSLHTTVKSTEPSVSGADRSDIPHLAGPKAAGLTPTSSTHFRAYPSWRTPLCRWRPSSSPRRLPRSSWLPRPDPGPRRLLSRSPKISREKGGKNHFGPDKNVMTDTRTVTITGVR